MIPSQFVYLAIVLSAFGAYGYIRDTLRGETSPNRVTWSLWGVEGILGFGVEVQQHIALAGLVFWAFVNEPTIALISFVCADTIAALPTLRKSWLAPSTESSRVFVMGCINCVITVLTLKVLTTAGVLYPGCVAVTDFVMSALIISRIGPRVRKESVIASPTEP